jgi:hypothetical protein
MPYIGNQPGTGVRSRFIYTATASQTTFSGADNNSKTLKYADSDYIDVYLNGVCLVPGTDYTASTKTSIVLTQAASLSDTLEVVAYDIATISDTVSKADGGTFEANVTFAAAADIITATAGTDNVRLGENAGNSIESGGTNNVVIGKNAGTAITTADHNTAVGHQAGEALTTGARSTLVGYASGAALIDPDRNVAFGYGSLQTDTKGSKSTAIGYSALNTQNFTSATDSHNTAVGYTAGESLTTGQFNTFVGSLAGDANTTASGNSALGYLSLSGNTTGEFNAAVGREAMEANTEGSNNTALGFRALEADTKGSHSVAVGRQALKVQNFTSATDSHNTAVGNNAGQSVTTGTENTIVGSNAGYAFTTGGSNVAVGKGALSTETAGNNNVAIGHGALDTQNNTGGGNVYNNALGYSAGAAITTGAYNTLMGGFAGDAIQSGGSNICLGYGADVAHDTANGITIGVNIEGATNDFSFGKASNVVKNDFDADANWSRSSDERLKKNITDQKLGLDFINDLRTVKYNWKASHELDSTDSQLSHLYKEDEADNEMNTDATMHNFIAQEVKAALDTAGVSDFGGWSEDDHGVQQVSREMFVIPLVKAVQELSAKNDALETQNTTQATQIADLITRVTALEAG